MQCPKCKKEKAIIHPQYGVMQGKNCVERDRRLVGKISQPPEFPTQTMNDRITDQRIRHEKDIIQPYINGKDPDPEFVKAYPDLAKNYFTDEQLEKL